MALVEHGALRIDVAEAGAGPLVLLAHSSVSGNRQWRRLIDLLSPRFRVRAPNLIGYGLTPAWSAGRRQTIDDGAALLLALCEGEPGPIRLVGHSWGAVLSLRAAHVLGERCSHLLLYEPMLAGLLRDDAVHWPEVGALYDDVERLGVAGDWTALARRFTDYFNGDGAWDATPPDRREAVTAALPPNLHEWRAGAPAIGPDAFAGIRARVLLMRGQATRTAAVAMADLLGRSFPPWRREVLPGAGHMGPLTHAEAFNRRAVDFLLAG
jgi:pimeloyl-ACP methyl ester carboxylesterase